MEPRKKLVDGVVVDMTPDEIIAREAKKSARAALIASESYKWNRREAIVAAWPPEAQLEALTEAAAGDTTKIDALIADIAAIKARFPKPSS